MPRFKDLNTAEILALAISLEEEDAQILTAFADKLEAIYPQQAEEFCWQGCFCGFTAPATFLNI